MKTTRPLSLRPFCEGTMTSVKGGIDLEASSVDYFNKILDFLRIHSGFP